MGINPPPKKSPPRNQMLIAEIERRTSDRVTRAMIDVAIAQTGLAALGVIPALVALFRHP